MYRLVRTVAFSVVLGAAVLAGVQAVVGSEQAGGSTTAAVAVSDDIHW
jgi:hypothetical protein